MKRILLALTMLAIFLPAARQAEAADVSIDFFYDNLNDGSWVEVGDYGYCWQPSVAVSSTSWRPYADGYWAYTDVGWTWVSNEDFGWATYHYGRWARLSDVGWVWVPGTEWGPAWVSWRTGGDHIGWAPLPPRGRSEVVYEGRPITGHVDIEFDIGPTYYNFVDVRYIGEPNLRERIYEPSRNVTYISNTVNVTNITYNNSVVYNHGPDYNHLSRYSTRPIRRLTLERQTNVDVRVALQNKSVTKVEGTKLIVAAPMKIQKPAQPRAPKVVKTKIQQAKVERGWAGISDPNAKAQLQQKMKAEDAKNIPPPKSKPGAPAPDAPVQSPAAAPPAMTAAPETSPSPEAATPPARSPMPKTTPTPRGAPATSPAIDESPARKGPREKPKAPGSRPVPEPQMDASPGTVPEPSPGAEGRGEKRKRGGQDLRASDVPVPLTTEKSGDSVPEPKPNPGRSQMERGTDMESPAGGPAVGQKGKRKPERETPEAAAATQPDEPKAPTAGKRSSGPAAEAAPGGAAKGDQEKRGGEKKKKKGAEESPAPGPGQ